MLISFAIENFLSIKEEMVFSMEATNYKSEHKTNDFTIGRVNLLKTAVIFGPNASGKSNLIFAMKKMRDIVTENKNTNSIRPFKFNEDTENEPTKFEVTFLYNNIVYRYGFKIKNKIIVKEWLFYKKNQKGYREYCYFERNGQEFQNFSDYKKEADLIKKEDKTREDKLYLSVVAEFNGVISREIISWFEIFNSFSGIHSDVSDYTLEKLKNEKSKEKIINLMQSADFGIASINEKKIDFKDIKIPNEEEIPAKILEDLQKNDIVSIETFHHKYKDKKFVGFEPISIGMESDGTKKLFDLSGTLIEALEKGEILVVDELDNSFHTKMTEQLIKLFNSDRNVNNAQLIFVSHDTNILTQRLFRRDQIWFTEKNMYGESNLFSLIDFGTRKDTALQKNYLDGKYGSIPYIAELEF